MKKERSVNRYKTHTLLLHSTSSLSFPLTEIPPVFGPRAPTWSEGTNSSASADHVPMRSSREADAPGGAEIAANAPGGTSAPGTETNGMQGPLISFCALCGREFEPQKARRGQSKKFCSNACRARAWRRRDATQNSQKSRTTSQGLEFCDFCAAFGAAGPEVSAPFDSHRGDLRSGRGMNADDPSAS